MGWRGVAEAVDAVVVVFVDVRPVLTCQVLGQVSMQKYPLKRWVALVNILVTSHGHAHQ